MGNHDVGRGMAAGAEAFLQALSEPTKEQALAALDALAKPYVGADAEFDDALHSLTPLSRLVGIAFEATEDEWADLNGERDFGRVEDAGELWYDGPTTRFRKRYGFW